MPAPTEQTQTKFEKRRHPRRAWMPKVSGMFISDDGRRNVEQLQGIDISECGMGIAAAHSYPLGTQLIIDIPVQNQRGRYVHAKVVRCWEENSQIRMGLEFNDVPNDTVIGAKTNQRRAA